MICVFEESIHPSIHPSSTAFSLNGITEGGAYPSCLGGYWHGTPWTSGQLIAALKYRDRPPFTLSHKVKGQVKVTHSPTHQMHVCGLCEEPRQHRGGQEPTQKSPLGSLNPEFTFCCQWKLYFVTDSNKIPKIRRYQTSTCVCARSTFSQMNHPTPPPTPPRFHCLYPAVTLSVLMSWVGPPAMTQPETCLRKEDERTDAGKRLVIMR